MKHLVFGQLTKQYSEREYDIYLSDGDIWVIMLGDEEIGFTWEGYNSYSVKENITKAIQYYEYPETAVWL